MRRVFTFMTAAALVVVSLGIGLVTADLPFWRRAFALPVEPDALYLPVVTLGAAWARETSAPPEIVSLDAARLEAAAERARAGGSRALLVIHRGRLQLERYFIADGPESLLPAALVARPLAAMAVGLALHDGTIASLEAPVSNYLGEWTDDARGRITLRQLLEDTSGLEAAEGARELLRRSLWDGFARLPVLATSRGVRMLLGSDFESCALGFPLEHEPGGFFKVSPANTQLVAVILERATGESYENFLDRRLWSALGAGPADLQLDRRAGMPAAHCCWRARARDMARAANLLATGGLHAERQILPIGWAARMGTASRVSPESGLQVARLEIDGLIALSSSDDFGSAFWVVPERELTILNIVGRSAASGRGGGDPAELPRLVLAALPGG